MTQYQKIMCSILTMVFIPMGFADAPSSSSTDSLNNAAVLQALNSINTQLQTIANNQAQTQQAFQNYTQFQLNALYPTVPFPGWKGVQINPLQSLGPDQYDVKSYISGTINFGSEPTLKAQENQKAQLLSSIAAYLNKPEAESNFSNDLNQYVQLLNTDGAQMNTAQSARLISQLLVLNAKASYLEYQEQKRLESLLIGQLVIQSQQKPTQVKG